MYLAYLLADIGYNLQEWNIGTVLLVMVGWMSLLYRQSARRFPPKAAPHSNLRRGAIIDGAFGTREGLFNRRSARINRVAGEIRWHNPFAMQHR